MFGKTMVRGLVAAALAATVLRGIAMAQVVLPTQEQLSALGATQYQIAFVTTDKTSGTSASEGTYNAIATTEARSNATLNALNLNWTAITTTTNTDASVNAPTHASVPIFNTAGQLILADGSQLYASSDTLTLTNALDYDENGMFSATPAWTGGYADAPTSPFPLGQSASFAGDSYYTDIGWSIYSTFAAVDQFPVYALSSPASVPEPSTLALLRYGTGGPWGNVPAPQVVALNQPRRVSSVRFMVQSGVVI